METADLDLCSRETWVLLLIQETLLPAGHSKEPPHGGKEWDQNRNFSSAPSWAWVTEVLGVWHVPQPLPQGTAPRATFCHFD